MTSTSFLAGLPTTKMARMWGYSYKDKPISYVFSYPKYCHLTIQEYNVLFISMNLTFKDCIHVSLFSCRSSKFVTAECCMMRTLFFFFQSWIGIFLVKRFDSDWHISLSKSMRMWLSKSIKSLTFLEWQKGLIRWHKLITYIAHNWFLTSRLSYRDLFGGQPSTTSPW